jgi:hypothetical protein
MWWKPECQEKTTDYYNIILHRHIYLYICTHCPSLFKLWVRFSYMVRCTRYILYYEAILITVVLELLPEKTTDYYNIILHRHTFYMSRIRTHNFCPANYHAITNKTLRHDMTELLLRVSLNPIIPLKSTRECAKGLSIQYV